MESRWSAIALLLSLFFAIAGTFLTGTASAQVKLEILDPRGEIAPPPLTPISPRLQTLAGKKIGILNNTKGGADAFQPYLEKALKNLVPTVEFRKFVIPYNGYPEKESDLKKLVAWSDGVIGILGD